MKQTLKRLIKSTPLYPPLKAWHTARMEVEAAERESRAEVIVWERNGRPSPPPHLVKREALLRYAREFRLRVLVETGTFRGDMVEAMRKHFARIYSIELSQDLHVQAVARFKDKGRHIMLVQGDSGQELGRIVAELREPALFWLDGHYSGGITAKGEKETPIFEELNHIFGSKVGGHVIVIDDARCFGTLPAYPTLDALAQFVRARQPAVEIVVQDDSIRITPRA